MAEPQSQLHAAGVTIERGGNLLLREVSLTLAPGDRVGLLGPNGAGKSSLLAALSGGLAPVTGAVSTTPSGAAVGLLRQELDATSGESVAEFIARKTGVAEASAELDAATDALGEATEAAFERHQQALEAWLRLGGDDIDQRLPNALLEVGLDEPDLASRPATALSGGQQAKVGLAAVLLARHDVLLLDEPTNNLDRTGLDLLERHLLGRRGALMVVSHDRRFMERVVTAVVELDPYGLSAVRYEEPYRDYLRSRDVAARHARERYESYTRERDRLHDRARTQRQWAAKGLRAERTPPDNDRAARGFRIEKTEKLAAKARQTERAIDRLETVDKPWQPWELQFDIGIAERAGDLVAELVGGEVVRDSFVLGPVTLSVGAGERMAVVGGNGAGKTTLARALFGRIALTTGENRVGPGTRLGWLDQDRLALTPGADALDHLMAEAPTLAISEARSLLAKFGLGADHLGRPSEALSPGERTRLVLATFQANGINTLVLDEPTNHLDIEAITQLEQALGRYRGTLLLVSHDRAFLDATRLTRRVTVDHGQVVADEPLSAEV